MSRREATIKTREEWISKREAQFRIQQVPVKFVWRETQAREKREKREGDREREREREGGRERRD